MGSVYAETILLSIFFTNVK